MEEALTELELAWGSILDIAVKTNSESDIIIACHRLISYNPQSTAVKQYFPEISKAADVIAQIAKIQVDSIAKDPNSRSSFISLAFCYLILRDYPNAYSSVAHAIRIDDKISDMFFLVCSWNFTSEFSIFSISFNFL